MCLNDMELVGHQFTWERDRGTEEWMGIRLDRALTRGSWFELFPLAKLYNLKGSISDHSSLLLIPRQLRQSNGPKCFRFENSWLTEPMCEQLTHGSWEANTEGDILQKVRNCGDQLMAWGKELT